MKIKVFCCFYNEAFLIPFFLSHYHFVDAIYAFVSPSQDATRELLAADPRVTIDDRLMPDGIDDEAKSEWLTEAIGQVDHIYDWYFVVDADEFMWPPNDPAGETVRGYLSAVPESDAALLAHMAHIYRVEGDADLDINVRPVGLQRRHGYGHSVKPAVMRSNRGIVLRPGNHFFRTTHHVSTTHAFHGAHWQNADPCFSVTRRVRDRGDRISPLNRLKGHGDQHWNTSVEAVEAELVSHRHDAQLF